MIKQPYSYWLIVLGGAGWDMKESLESNLHVYGKDDIKIIVYKMERCTKKKKKPQIGTLVQFHFQQNHIIPVT